MNLEDLKSYLEYADKAATILGRRIDPIGTELSIVKDVIAEVRTIRISNRDLALPGIKRWENVVIGAVAWFKEKVKKDIMPLPFAKADNLIVEPVYRPHIFGLNNFQYTTPSSVPATVTLLDYSLKSDKEIIILTDIVLPDPEPPITEIQISVDGVTYKPYSLRKDIKISDLHIYELPFPAIADVSLKIDARAEVGDVTSEWLPIGIHVVIGSELKGLT